MNKNLVARSKAFTQPTISVAMSTGLQRKCACGQHTGGAGCEESRKKTEASFASGGSLQRAAVNREPASEVPPIVYDVLRSPGQPLDPETRAFFEPRFGFDFSQVRIHTDTRAAESARAVNALAFAVGRDVVFGAGRYAPETSDGRRLLAHELTHVIQQSAAASAPDALCISHVKDRAERAADAASNEILTAYPSRAVGLFRAERFGSDALSGRRLLARELTHVVQAVGRVARHVLQRAEIPYTQLTWGDFKGTAPAGTKLAALTSSGFSVPGWKPTQDAEDTGSPCHIGKTSATEFKVTVSVDPDIFDGVAPFMVQENSWVKDRYKDNGHAYCVRQIKECEQAFDTQAAKAKLECQKQVAPCTKAFAGGATSFKVSIDGDEVEVTNKADCATTLVKECKELKAKRFRFSLTDASGQTFAEVGTKKECRTGFFDPCADHMKDESGRLLKHEQGHFDISKVMAENAQGALKAKAATLEVTETKCGRTQAINAAIKSFNDLKAATVLSKIADDWQAQQKKAQKDYDDQTDHGLKDDKQTEWESKITGGLGGYKPAPPAPPPAPKP